MKILFDTNVLFAAFATQGLCLEVVDRGVERFDIITSDDLLDELTDALRRKLKLGSASKDALAELREICEIVDPDPLPEPVCSDPDDDRVLAAAAAGGARFLVTGDDDLLVLRRYRGIRIVSPRQFLDMLEKES